MIQYTCYSVLKKSVTIVISVIITIFGFIVAPLFLIQFGESKYYKTIQQKNQTKLNYTGEYDVGGILSSYFLTFEIAHDYNDLILTL